MKTITTVSALALLTCACAAYAQTPTTPMLPSGGRDMTPLRAVQAPPPSRNVERAPVRYSWRVDPGTDIAAPQPHVTESREYWKTVDAAELQRGIALQATAPGALVRVSPAAGAAPVDAGGVRVTRGGRAVPLARRNSSPQLQAAGLAVPDGTAAVQLDRSAGAGAFSVQASDARGRYVVHVFEPESDVRLFAALGRDRVLAGGRADIAVNLQDGPTRIRGVKAGGLLVAPDGRTWPVALKPGRDGILRGQASVPDDVGDAPGLWEVQVFAGDGTVQRDARTAFSVALPTARLAGGYRFDARRLQFTLPVEAASPGRYEARGTQSATAPDGVARPVSVAHSAQWMSPGSGDLVLAFDRTHLPAGYGAPFELRQLELNDQSRMAPVERRERAARIAR